MRNAYRSIIGTFFLALSCRVDASTLNVVVPNHLVMVKGESERSAIALRAVWQDERVIANVDLDIFELSEMPSTKKDYDALRAFASTPRWTDEFSWKCVRRDTRQGAIGVTPKVLRAIRRERGPNAPLPADRDTAVLTTTLSATFDIGLLPVGDYSLTVTAASLSSSFEFSVRGVLDPETRDEYLRDKGTKTREYAAFRKIQLERFERNPAALDALLDLLDRTLQEGTPEEMATDFDRVIAAYRVRRGTFSPSAVSRVDSYIRDLETARNALPRYIAHREEWTMTRDTPTNAYAIRSRSTNQLLEELRGASR